MAIQRIAEYVDKNKRRFGVAVTRGRTMGPIAQDEDGDDLIGKAHFFTDRSVSRFGVSALRMRYRDSNEKTVVCRAYTDATQPVGTRRWRTGIGCVVECGPPRFPMVLFPEFLDITIPCSLSGLPLTRRLGTWPTAPRYILRTTRCVAQNMFYQTVRQNPSPLLSSANSFTINATFTQGFLVLLTGWFYIGGLGDRVAGILKVPRTTPAETEVMRLLARGLTLPIGHLELGEPVDRIGEMQVRASCGPVARPTSCDPFLLNIERFITYGATGPDCEVAC